MLVMLTMRPLNGLDELVDMTEEEVYKDYRAALEELQMNSKPHINMLTMLAEEGHFHAKVVVKAVEERLAEVPPELKLPILYVLDSIIKNLKESDYMQLFEKNIVSLFVNTFEQVDERMRQALYKLRLTWNDIFPNRKLYAIDVAVNKIDSGWPITAEPEVSIHVNPNFIAKGKSKILNAVVNNTSDSVDNLKICGVNSVVMCNSSEQQTDSNTSAQNNQSMLRDPRLKRLQEKDDEASEPISFEAINCLKKKAIKLLTRIEESKSAKKKRNKLRKRPFDILKELSSSSSSSSSEVEQQTGENSPKRAKTSAFCVDSEQEDDDDECRRDETLSLFGATDQDYRLMETKVTTTGPIQEDELMASENLLKLVEVKRKEGVINEEQHRELINEIKLYARSNTNVSYCTPSTNVVCPSLPIDRGAAPNPNSHIASPFVMPQFPLINQFLASHIRPPPSLPSFLPPGISHPVNVNSISFIPPSPLSSAAFSPIIPPMSTTTTTNVAHPDQGSDICDLKHSQVNHLDNKHPLRQIPRCLIGKGPEIDQYFKSFPPIQMRNEKSNEDDHGILEIDGRSYMIKQNVRRIIQVYNVRYEFLCDSKTKTVYINSKPVLRFGEAPKTVDLPCTKGRRANILYMGRQVDAWIDNFPFEFRADAPPKIITVASRQFAVHIDGCTNELFVNNVKVAVVGQPLTRVSFTSDEKLNNVAHEIRFTPPPKQIIVDQKQCTMRYDLPLPCIEMNGRFYGIRFNGPPREIYIDGIPHVVPFDRPGRIKFGRRAHEIAWGGPGFEVIIDGRSYEIHFNQPPREVFIGSRPHQISIRGPAPEVKILNELPFTDKISDEDIVSVMSQMNSAVPGIQAAPSHIDVNKLYDSLLKHGIINNLTDVNELNNQVENDMIEVHDEKPDKMVDVILNEIPDLTQLRLEPMKSLYPSLIEGMYSGDQCPQCGLRFSEDMRNRYQTHLDWHFRKNKREKDVHFGGDTLQRDWYYLLDDWLKLEEIRDEFDIPKPEDESDGHSTEPVSSNFPCSCSAANNDQEDICFVCLEPFEQFYHEDRDEWHLKDAIRVNGKTYHPVCYQDAKEVSKVEDEVNEETVDDEKAEAVLNETLIDVIQSVVLLNKHTDEVTNNLS